MFTGPQAPRSNASLTTWLFLRLLGLVYLGAFASLDVQILGLVGSAGVLPAAPYLNAVSSWASQNGIGWSRYFLLPTFAWLNASDVALQVHCVLGIALSLILIAGLAPTVCLVGLWALYLSLTTICRDFLSFQWDALLLETGFLAIFLAGPTRTWRPDGTAEPAPVMLWLMRWLLFRLMFSSGAVKLASGDPTWRNLTALSYHFETQPLPTWVGWYAHQLPLWFHRATCLGVLAIELGAPLLIAGSRRSRMIACAAFAWLQILIAVTGNYAYFNFLTIALALLLLEDADVARRLPHWMHGWFHRVQPAHSRWGWPRWVAIAAAVLLVPTSVVTFGQTIGVGVALPPPFDLTESVVQPLRIVNGYGLFAVMTTSRPEIIVEGSDDGINWKAYEFRFKPGDPERRPGFVAPHQPRLDWQMWFAALDRYENNPWLANLSQRLLEGSLSVLSLLAYNPFPNRPPRLVRTVLYDYRFTSLNAGDDRQAWWRRTRLSSYGPVLSAEGTFPRDHETSSSDGR